MKFSIRDLLWLTLVAACCVLWWIDRVQLNDLQRLDRERLNPRYPVGQVSDAFWESQQETDEAVEFVFHDHEFLPGTADFAPGAKRHLEMVALRMEHAPFPIRIEASQDNSNQKLAAERRQVILKYLARMGVTCGEERVVY